MTQEEIFDGLKEILRNIRPQMDFSSVTMDSRLLEDMAVDSLSMLLLALAVEQKYGFQFEDQVRFQTVREVVEYTLKAIG